MREHANYNFVHFQMFWEVLEKLFIVLVNI